MRWGKVLLINLRERRFNPRLHLLLFYVVCNSYAYFLFLFQGKTSGEFDGVPVDGIRLTVLYALIILGYLAIYYLYKLADGIYVTRRPSVIATNSDRKTTFVDVFVFLVQVILLYYVLSEGAFTAGKETPSGFVSKFAKVFVPDGIFMAYYAKYRNSRWFLAIAIVWAVSMLLRGWGGTLFIFAVAEYGWFLYSRNKNLKVLLLFALVFALLSPYVYSLRNIVRGQEALISGAGIVGLVTLLSDSDVREEAASSGPGVMESLSLRFQHLGSVYMISEHSTEIARQIETGAVNPFYTSFPFLTVLNKDGAVDITKYISKYAEGGGGWYIHTGMVGWILIVPEQLILYIVFLVVSVFLLVFSLNFDRRATEFTAYFGFVACLLYLVFGWYSVFFSFIQGALVILGLNVATSTLRLAVR